MNQELDLVAEASLTPELEIIVNHFTHLNVEISELIGEIGHKINQLKNFPPETVEIGSLPKIEVPSDLDIAGKLSQQLANLEVLRIRLNKVFNHIQTII